MRIQEVVFYRAKCDELTGGNLGFLDSNSFASEHEDIIDEITKSRHKDLEGSIDKLRKFNEELTNLRDSWITKMLDFDK